MRLQRNTFVLLIIALTTVACGARGTGGVSVDDTLDGRELLAAAPAATRDAGTAHMTMIMELSGPGLGPQQPDGVTITTTGQVDFDGQSMSMTVDMTPAVPGVGTTLRYILTPEALYMSMPILEQQVGATWIRMRYAEVDDEFGLDLQEMMTGDAIDPTAMLDQLHGVSDEIDNLGEEVIDGITTTHYRATVTRDAVIANTPEGRRTSVEQLVNGSGFPETYDVEVWIDADNLVRKMTTALSAHEIETAMVITWSDYGAPVDIVVPTDSIIEFSDWLARIREMNPATNQVPG